MRLGTSRAKFVVLLGLLSFCAILIGYRALLGLPLIGFDCYPLIASARVQSLADLWGLVSEELMDGRYTDGRFYRPVTHASFALDYAVHGLQARGYHLTDLLLLAAACTAAGAAALRLFGERARLTAVIAAATLGLHPLVMEVVPVAARRADTLAIGFGALLVACAPRPGQGRDWWGLLWAALAVGSKESGALAPLVLAAWAWLEVREQRWRHALDVAVPAFLGLGLMLVLRGFVLGELGGHGESGLPSLALSANLAKDYALLLLYPQPWAGNMPALRTAVWVTLALLALGAWIAGRNQEASRPGLVLAWFWAFAVLAISLLSGRLHDWYGIGFLIPYGLLLGELLRVGLITAKAKRWAIAGLLSIPASLLLTSHLATSHVLRPYDNLLRAGTVATKTFAELDRLLASGQPGHVLTLDPWSPVLPGNPDGSQVRNLFLFGHYSMQAYADLHASYPVRVGMQGGRAPEPDPGFLRVELVHRPPPYWFSSPVE